MLYNVLRWMLSVSVRIYFGRIKVYGLNNFPVNKPVLIASNHPNAFLDAMVLAAFSKRQLHFLARSDAFDTSFKTWLLEKINLIPIYRIEEGADKLHRNEETFRKCYNLLSKNAAIIIFPEGVCIQERKLRKLRKGMARIAFGSMEAGGLKPDIHILPAGVNYFKPQAPSGDLVINFGPCLKIRDYLELYQQDKARAMIKLNSDTEAAMAKELIIVEDVRNEKLVTQLEEILSYDVKNGMVYSIHRKYNTVKSLASVINQLHRQAPEELVLLNSQVDEFFRAIQQKHLRNDLINFKVRDLGSSRLLVPKYLLLLVFFPFFLSGALLNYIPYRIPHLIARKTVSNIEFFASVNFTSGMFVFIFYYLICAALFSAFTGVLYSLLILISGPILGRIAFNYRNLWQETRGLQYLKGNPELLDNLLGLKTSIRKRSSLIMNGMNQTVSAIHK